jgi:hypothetical protein
VPGSLPDTRIAETARIPRRASSQYPCGHPSRTSGRGTAEAQMQITALCTSARLLTSPHAATPNGGSRMPRVEAQITLGNRVGGRKSRTAGADRER